MIFTFKKLLLFKTALLSLALLTNLCNVSGQGAKITFTTNTYNRFTVPPGVTSITVELWGGGGAANSDSISNLDNSNLPNFIAYGGGGGAYVKSTLLPVSPGEIITLQIGNGAYIGNDEIRYKGEGGATSVTGSFGTLTANPGTYRFGGASSTGANIGVSYKGGDAGATTQLAGKWSYGGGGAAGGPIGNGEDGQNGTLVNGTKGGKGGSGASGGGAGGDGFDDAGNAAYDASYGKAPGGGAGGKQRFIGSNQGGDGQVILSYDCTPQPGTIANEHSVPYPPQLIPDQILHASGDLPTAMNGLLYRWEQSTNNIDWLPAKTPTSAISYRFDQDSIKQTTYYRRGTNACYSTSSFSNVVKIRAVNPPNGAISGTVRSKNGFPVPGITIYAKKTSSLPGSPSTYIDSTVTGPDGQYSLTKLYYGDVDGGASEPKEATFLVTPFKESRGFSPGTLSRTLVGSQSNVVGVDFTDTTALAVSGRVVQVCDGCLNNFNSATTILSPEDSVEIYLDNAYNTRTSYSNPPGNYGRFSITIADPKTYKIEPRYKNHSFSPGFLNVNVTGNITNLEFADTSTRTISGRFTAGCNEVIGNAVLEFSDILPKDKDGNPRLPDFRKRVTTSDDGTYSITLPARKYKMTVISFTSKDDVASADLLEFFNVKLAADSVSRDITTSNARLNLVYNRPPVITLSNLEAPCAGGYPVFVQGENKTFYVNVYQGPAAKGCRASDAEIQLISNIQSPDDVTETISAVTSNGQSAFKFKGGGPNIVAPYTKSIFISYTDPAGRKADLLKDVLVTGVQSGTQTFTTVSPEIPFMVLHDPPGDNSFSLWETSKTNETAFRMYAAKETAVDAWAQVKLGVKYEAGVIVSSEFAQWGTIKGSFSTGAKISGGTEAILSTTTTQSFSTANNPEVIGVQGDVFVGAAMNLVYGVAQEVIFDAAACSTYVAKKLMVANNGFATQYVYTENHIRNTIIPALILLRDNPANTPAKTRQYANQVSVWQQTLANNESNKAKAAFDKNISFDGASGPVTSTTTASSSKSNTVQFDLNVDLNVALELGLEVGGSGFSEGVDVSFKTETGESTTSTALASSTLSYTLDDDDNGDYYSVNIKKDPVYNSPVFEMVAGTTSCPYEPGTQPRDGMQLTVPIPVKSGIAADGDAEFIIKLANTSPSAETRTYNLSFIQSSNPNGAVVTIGGSPTVNPIPYSINYLGEVEILVKVKRGASGIFSYEGLQFIATDNCDGSIQKTVSISAFFNGACSPVSLISPEVNWKASQKDNNILQVLFNGYQLNNLTSISMEYSAEGSSNWLTGFIKLPAGLNNSPNGSAVNWDISGVPDGNYALRMKLVCPEGIIYSSRVTGTIDRKPPQIFGKPEPANGILSPGDYISIRYNKLLDGNTLTAENIVMVDKNTGTPVDIFISGFQNQIVVSPVASLSTLADKSYRVFVRGIADPLGNKKTVVDSFEFRVLNLLTATGAPPVNLEIQNADVYENAGTNVNNGDSSISVYFELPAPAANQMRVNFSVSGTAIFDRDYKVKFDSVGTDQKGNVSLNNAFKGTTGSIIIAANSKRAILKITPVDNSIKNTDRTLSVNLLEGGDYTVGPVNNVNGTIINDDASSVYIFSGTGNFNEATNWITNAIPPPVLPSGDTIIIRPSGSECILNVPQTLAPGSNMIISEGKVLRVKKLD